MLKYTLKNKKRKNYWRKKMHFKQETIKYLSEKLDLDVSLLEEIIEIPPQRDMGDLALPCFRFAKEFRKSPMLIAQDFNEKLKSVPEFIDKFLVLGPYLNVYFNQNIFIKDVVHSILEAGDNYLMAGEGEGKNVVLDFSSPNIAKPFHVGHAFSTILGDVIANFYKHRSYTVHRINHLGDYGTQFGKLIVAYEKWGNPEELKENPIKELLRIYVKFHQEAELDESLIDVARTHFKNLENGNEYETKLWKSFREYSLEEFKKIYRRMDMKFDSYKGEAFYVDMLPQVIELLDSKNLLVESQGAQVVELGEYDMPDMIIRKSDGSSIYATRDIAAALYRHEQYNFDKLIYVVGLPQELHFRQLFKILELAGFSWSKNMEFVGFGLVKFPEGVKFSTRTGDVIYLEELLDESVNKVKEIIIANNQNREEKMSETEIGESAEIIGLAAVKYTYLRNSRERDIIFSWDEILDFDGDTASYMLYSYARAKSILRRAEFNETEILQADLEVLDSDVEFELCIELNNLETALLQAMRNSEPSTFARQIMNTCRSFSRFYNQQAILQAESEELKLARLALCEAFTQAIKVSLGLLGINTVERM